jgi:hypothetical protein
MYIPAVGDSVCGRKKIKITNGINMVVGPIVEADGNYCRIVTNKGTKTEGDFRLNIKDWTFQFLHKTNE